MDAPQIRYTKTGDGVSIAYWAIGSGPAFVIMDVPYSHLQFEWQMPFARELYEQVALVGTVVRYDHRGFGLSDRDVGQFTTEGFVADLEAVVDRLELETFYLIGQRSTTGAIAVNYVAKNPGRVRRLVITYGGVREDPQLVASLQTLIATPHADWRFVSESISRLAQGWDEDAVSRALAECLRQAISLDGFKRFLDYMARTDASSLLPEITVPTLFVAARGHPIYGPEQASEAIAAMPDASLAVIDGSVSSERARQLNAAVVSFLAPDFPQLRSMRRRTRPAAGTAVILFADVADSTALTERLGDAVFRAAARELDERMRAAIRDAGGTPVEGKVLGDGVMAVFTSAAQAIDAGRRCVELSAASELPLHVGLHAGDVIREESNVYGGAVNIAARVCDASSPGEILVSETVRGLARTSARVSFEDRGERALKGIEEPVRVWAVVEGAP